MTQDSPQMRRDEPFLLIEHDGPSRVQGQIGLIPARGGRIKRRAVIYALVAWLPLVVASWLAEIPVDHGAQAAETLLGHFEIHVRCLIAIPLLILAEGVAQKNLVLCLREFKRSGLVDQALSPRCDSVVADVSRLKKRVFPWVIITTLVIAWTVTFLVSPNPDELQWAGTKPEGSYPNSFLLRENARLNAAFGGAGLSNA